MTTDPALEDMRAGLRVLVIAGLAPVASVKDTLEKVRPALLPGEKIVQDRVVGSGTGWISVVGIRAAIAADVWRGMALDRVYLDLSDLTVRLAPVLAAAGGSITIVPGDVPVTVLAAD